jgi:hypothetical protein
VKLGNSKTVPGIASLFCSNFSNCKNVNVLWKYKTFTRSY